jgi:ABC-type transporter Mla MlaB component
LSASDESTTRAGRARLSQVPNTIVLVMTGPVEQQHMATLCERVRTLLEGCDADLVVCDVGVLDEPDAVTVDVLARLQLTARRLGRRVQLFDASGELEDLLSLTGLSAVLPCGELDLESRGEAEEREPTRSVEEEADPADPVS